MDKKFQIGEIARFFDMPASTFRYWEDKGILHPRKKIENQGEMLQRSDISKKFTAAAGNGPPPRSIL